MKVTTQVLKYADLFPAEAAKLAKRLHQKKDEIQFVRKFYTSEKADINKSERSVVSYISTKIVDRDGEQLLPEGVVLDNYKKNPVVLYGHDYKSVPIAKNIWIKPDDQGLIAKTAFGNSEFADQIYRAYSEDIAGTGPLCKAFSVGFIPIEYEDMEIKSPGDPRRIYKKWELLEYSCVPIPSCPEALTLAVEKGIIPKSVAIDMAEELDIKIEDFQVELDEEDKAWLDLPDGTDEGDVIALDQGAYDLAKMADEIEEKMEIVLKPETTDNYHHIPVRDKESFVQTSFRTITISKKKGIKAVIGKLTSDPRGSTKTQKFLFDVNKWTMAEAKKWVKENHESKGFLDSIQKIADMEGNPSIDDIRVAISMALVPKWEPDTQYPWLLDVYVTDYPSGHFTFGENVEDQTRVYMQDYTYADSKITFEGEPTEVIISYSEKSAEDREVEIALMTQIMDKLDALNPVEKTKETEIVIEPDKPIEVVLDAEPPVKPIEIVLEPEPVKKEGDIVKAYLNSEDFKTHVNESIRHELARLRGKVE